MSFDYTTNAQLWSAIGGMLKEDWISDTIRDQYARDNVLMALLEKNSREVSGEKAVFSVRLGPNVSTGARSEMAALPDPGKQLVKKVEVGMSFWYTSVCFSGPAMAASRNDATALAKVVTDELDNGVKDHKKVENFFMYGDGSGFLARITDIDSLTLTVDRWTPVFQVGRVLDSFTAKTGGSAGMDSRTITAVDRANKTITMSAVTSAQVGDYLFLEDMRGVSCQGLLGGIDDGTYVTTIQSLSRTTYPQLKAKRFHNSGTPRNISEAILMSVVARQREDGARPNLLIGTSFQLNDLCLEAKVDRRFLNPEMKAKLGIEGIELGDGVTFTFDPDCWAGMCFALTKEDIEIAEMAPLGFMDKDGNVLSRIVGPRRDGYEATLVHYFNLIFKAFYNQARIEDLNENRYGD